MLVVYPAEARDYHFIYAEVIRAAKHRHFLLETRSAEGRDLIRRNLKAMLHRGQLENGLRGQPLLFKLGNKNIGFALISEIQPGRGGHELHLFLVHHQYYGQGYGSAMLDEINRRWQGVDLYARCFPASQTLQQMLLRRGFVLTHTNAEGARVLVREKINL